MTQNSSESDLCLALRRASATTAWPMTVLEVLQSTTAYFQKREIESPRLNAEHLLAHSLGRKQNRALSRVRAAALRTGAGASARTGKATRPGRTAPASARDGRIRRPRFLERQTRAHSAPRNRTIGRISLRPHLAGRRAHSRCRHRQWSDCAHPGRPFSEGASCRPSISLRTRSRSRAKMPRGSAFRTAYRFSQGDLLEKAEGAFDLIVANLPYVAASEAAQLAPEAAA